MAFSGTISLPGIADALSANPGQTPLIFIGFGLVVIGLLFKVGAVPFHQWGALTFTRALPAPSPPSWPRPSRLPPSVRSCVFLYVAFGGARWDWQPAPVDHRDRNDAGGVDFWLSPRDRHQAHARLFIDRPGRLSFWSVLLR